MKEHYINLQILMLILWIIVVFFTIIKYQKLDKLYKEYEKEVIKLAGNTSTIMSLMKETKGIADQTLREMQRQRESK